MPKKPSVSFADLGLSTPLPSVLTKTREQRRAESVQQKREKKLRTKLATEQVASARDAIEKHRQLMKEEATNEQQEKAQRKRELRIEHLKARNEREERGKAEQVELKSAQKAYITEVLEKQREDDAETKKIQALIAKEQSVRAKEAPRSVFIAVDRTESIEQQRAGLPVLREEQPIVEAINASNRSCVLICGETGSGKTTQIPQFLWEAGYGHPEGSRFGRQGCILVTEPRRVAALSMARRVAEELNVSFGKEVCYHVRYDNNLSEECRMKFATEGIILKEIQSDFLLKKYSVVIVDEAHERSISCDILIGLLSRIVPLRNDLFREELRAHNGDITKAKVKPLKLVIMSATMRVTDFRDNSTLFPITPQLINVEARRFPVTNHFARKTELKEYVDEAFEKVRQIHKKLPPGGILVFLCTQQEIEDLCSRLRAHYAKTKIEYYDQSYAKHSLLTGKSAEEVAAASSDSDTDDGNESGTAAELEKDEFGLTTEDYALEDEGEEHAATNAAGDRKGGGGGEAAAKKRSRMTNESRQTSNAQDEEINGELNTLHVLPLYALLDFQKQQEVFKTPPRGKRLCVVATNVAETSITIPNIKYVVDTGRVKSQVVDDETKASCFRIGWTSQASAEQRSGRAGRVGPGHCYRLFSTAVFANLMPKHSLPEILRTPLDSVVLLMKHIGIEHVGGFPFPSPPREADLKAALQHLSVIGALDPARGLRITHLGRQLVAYPVQPRLARVIVEALRQKCPQSLVDMVVAIVAMCATTSNVFTGEGNQIKASKKDDHSDPRREGIRALVNPGSDMLTFLNAFRVYARSPRSCRTYCLVQKSMHEAKMLSNQLRSLTRQQVDPDELADSLDVNETTKSRDFLGGAVDGELSLSKADEVAIRKLFISGFLDQVARRATVQECRSFGMVYNEKKTSRAAYLIISSRTIAFVHPTSALARTIPPPEYLTFAFLQKVVRSDVKEAQATMLGATVVLKEWLDEAGFDEE